MAMGLSNNTSFLRPITEGSCTRRPTRLHRGRTTWVWDVRFTDDAGRTCAITRMTIAVRPAPRASALPVSWARTRGPSAARAAARALRGQRRRAEAGVGQRAPAAARRARRPR